VRRQDQDLARQVRGIASPHHRGPKRLQAAAEHDLALARRRCGEHGRCAIRVEPPRPFVGAAVERLYHDGLRGRRGQRGGNAKCEGGGGQAA
jgi:hypothetical protein